MLRGKSAQVAMPQVHASDVFHAAPRRFPSRAPSPSAPVAVLFCDTRLLAAASARWLAGLGAGRLVAVGPPAVRDALDMAVDAAALPAERVEAALAAPQEEAALLARIAARAQGRWVIWCRNGEFPVFPWWETRSLGDLAAFQAGERRRGAGGWTVDLYAGDMAEAVERDDPGWEPPARCWFDGAGIFARRGPRATWERPAPRRPAPAGLGALRRRRAVASEDSAPRIYGGLAWRHAEDLPDPPPRLDRTPFFAAAPGLRPDAELRFGDPAVDGFEGRWHRSPTMAVMSFRAAARLLSDPVLAAARPDFRWSGSRPWDWRSASLLDAGIIEPGQWF